MFLIFHESKPLRSYTRGSFTKKKRKSEIHWDIRRDWTADKEKAIHILEPNFPRAL